MKPLTEGMAARDVRVLVDADMRDGGGLSTGTVHLACEMACHNILAPLFGGDDTSVGIGNDIWFWGDAVAGEQLVGEATVARIDGRRVLFNVFARAGVREIARGTHERMLVSMSRFLASMAS